MKLEQIIKNQNFRTAAFISAFYIITNIPAFVNTYTAPKEEIKGTLGEQLEYEMDSLRDISGGAVWSNFRLLGTSTGYIARSILKP